MTKEELLSLTKLIRKLLTEDERTRVDDYYLISKVLTARSPKARNMSLDYALEHSSLLLFPPVDSITRIRRDIQKAMPELSKKSVVQRRWEEEKIHKSFFGMGGHRYQT